MIKGYLEIDLDLISDRMNEPLKAVEKVVNDIKQLILQVLLLVLSKTVYLFNWNSIIRMKSFALILLKILLMIM